MSYAPVAYAPPTAPVEQHRSSPVWYATLGVLVVSVGLAVLVLDRGWGTAAQLLGALVVLAALVVLTLAARTISTGRSLGEGFVSALVAVFLLVPVGVGLFFAGSALSAVQEVGGILEDGALLEDGVSGEGSAFLECMADPETTVEDCEALE